MFRNCCNFFFFFVIFFSHLFFAFSEYLKEIYGKHGAKIAIMGRRENVLKESVEKLKEMNIDAIYVQGFIYFF